MNFCRVGGGGIIDRGRLTLSAPACFSTDFSEVGGGASSFEAEPEESVELLPDVLEPEEPEPEEPEPEGEPGGSPGTEVRPSDSSSSLACSSR